MNRTSPEGQRLPELEKVKTVWESSTADAKVESDVRARNHNNIATIVGQRSEWG